MIAGAVGQIRFRFAAHASELIGLGRQCTIEAARGNHVVVIASLCYVLPQVSAGGHIYYVAFSDSPCGPLCDSFLILSLF